MPFMVMHMAGILMRVTAVIVSGMIVPVLILVGTGCGKEFPDGW
jgi:hypothetical protein